MSDKGRQSALAATLVVLAAALAATAALGLLVWARGRSQAQDLAATVAALQTQSPSRMWSC
jgi:uncharacterized protein HemX